ncbi:MAG: hypothetical protein ACUVXG_05600 [Anaerolineae bacterium]
MTLRVFRSARRAQPQRCFFALALGIWFFAACTPSLSAPTATLPPTPGPTSTAPFLPTSTPWPTPTATPPATSKPLPSFPSLGFHLDQVDDALFQAAAEAGAEWVVVVFAWADIQPEPGYTYWEVPDQALAMARWYGLELVARLDQPPTWAMRPDALAGEPPVDLQAYTDFAAAAASRYRGQIPAYIIWNEPNLSLEWAGLPPDPVGYVKLLRAGSQAVKEADPDAQVVAAGLAPTTERSSRALDDLAFLAAMLDAGAGDWFDVLAVHPYGFALPPDASPRETPLCFRRIEQVWAELERRGLEKPLWATEAGWRARPDPGNIEASFVTPAQQAEYVLRAHDLAAGAWPWLERLGWWQLGGRDAYSLLLEGPEGWVRAPALEILVARRPRAPQTPANRSISPEEHPLASADVVVRLGDVHTLHPHWRHLSPSPRRWNQDFYLDFDPSGAFWELWLETMQVDQASSRIWINGIPLDPPYLGAKGFPDISSHWVTQSFLVPPEALQVGHNVLTIEVGPRYPAGQHSYWRFENLQLRAPRLRQAMPTDETPPAGLWQWLPSPGGWADVQFFRTVGQTLWAGAFVRGSLFRSEDGGKTWLQSDQGLGTAHVFDLLSVGAVLYAATDEGLFHSTDKGRVWAQHSCAAHTRLYNLAWWQDHLWLAGEQGIAQCPADNETAPATFSTEQGVPVLRLLTWGEGLVAAGAAGVWQARSQEGGIRWVRLEPSPGDGFVQDVFEIRSPPGGSLLVARQEENLFQWTDGRWTPFGPDGQGMTVTGSADGTWWLAGPGDRLARSPDGGETWETVEVPECLEPRHLLPLSDGLLVAGEWRLWRLEPDGSWNGVGPPLGKPAVTALVKHPQNPATWLAGTVGGVFLSHDAGQTWEVISPPWVVRDLAWGADGRLYAAHDDGIAVWQEGRWIHGQGPWPDIRYFAVSPGPHDPQKAVAGSWGNNLLWTADGGQTWEPVHGKLVTLSVYSILQDPPPGEGLLVGTAEHLFHSPNGRDKWVARMSPHPGRTTFALFRDEKEVLWAGTTDGLYRSQDGGASWEPVPLGRPATIIHLSGEGDTLWAGTEGYGLFRSLDAGQTWQWLGPAGVTVYEGMAAQQGWVAATSEGLMLLAQ